MKRSFLFPSFWIMGLFGVLGLIGVFLSDSRVLCDVKDSWGCLIFNLSQCAVTTIEAGLAATVLLLIFSTILGVVSGFDVPLKGVDAPSKITRFLGTSLSYISRLVLMMPMPWPRFALFVVLCGVWGYTPRVIGITAGVLFAIELGEMIRLRISSASKEEFIESAFATGLTKSDILFRHLLYYQCRHLYLQYIGLLWMFIISSDLVLGYLGFGAGLEYASWGKMIIEPSKKISGYIVIYGFADSVLTFKGQLLWKAFLTPLVLVIAFVASFASFSDLYSRPAYERGQS